MNRFIIRHIIRDIIFKIKKMKRNQTVYLPGKNKEYDFDELPFNFSIVMTVKINKNIEGFILDSFFIIEDDLIEIHLEFNPESLSQNLYELIGRLNDYITHELEHAHQSFRGEIDFETDTSNIEDPFEYYTQKHEISAQVAGFKRLSKLRRLPFENVVKDWFENNKDIHQLEDGEIPIVINMLMEKYKEKK